MKKILVLSSLGAAAIFLFFSIKYIYLVLGVHNQSEQLFKHERERFNELNFEGYIKKKIICNDCYDSKYQISIEISDESKELKIAHYYLRLPSIFHFDLDGKLNMSVNKKVYDSLQENDLVLKKANSNFLISNEKNLQVLGENNDKLIPE